MESQLDRAALALDEQRTAQASEAARAARAAHTPVGYPVDLLQARLSLALGLDAQGDVFALEALQAVDGVCAALGLRYDLAMRRDAVADADRLLELAARLPGRGGPRGGARQAPADSWTRRWRSPPSVSQTDPASVGLAQALAASWSPTSAPADGVALLSRIHALWPRNAGLLKRLAELQAWGRQEGRARLARGRRCAWTAATSRCGGWWSAQRTGKEAARRPRRWTAKAALKAYQAGPTTTRRPPSSSSTRPPPAPTPDGSSVDRIHTVQKVLDQSGIQEVAEVTLPPGAQLLALRTLKADGKVLEPESH